MPIPKTKPILGMTWKITPVTMVSGLCCFLWFMVSVALGLGIPLAMSNPSPSPLHLTDSDLHKECYNVLSSVVFTTNTTEEHSFLIIEGRIHYRTVPSVILHTCHNHFLQTLPKFENMTRRRLKSTNALAGGSMPPRWIADLIYFSPSLPPFPPDHVADLPPFPPTYVADVKDAVLSTIEHANDGLIGLLE